MDSIREYLPTLLEGLQTTVLVTALGILVGGIAATVLGTARTLDVRWVRWTATAVVEFFRGTSVIVQLFWAYYVLPPLTGNQIDPLTAAVVVLGLNSGSYASEAVRGAIQGVPQGQRDAAIALHMSPWVRLRSVILPQALPEMMPPFGNSAIDLLKASAVVGFVNVQDTTFWATQIQALTGQTLSVYGITLVMYFAVALVLAAIFRAGEQSLPLRRVERRTRRDQRPRGRFRLLTPALRRGGDAR
jgi:polar amino acid transport system permease protein